MKRVVLLVILLVGCTSGPIHLDMRYKLSKTTLSQSKRDVGLHASVVKGDKVCPVYITKIEDKRKKKQSFGSGVLGGETEAWVRQAFTRVDPLIENADIVIDPADATVELEVYIRKAYLYGVAINKVANVVLEARRDISETSKYYRGGHTAINWSGSDNEMQEALNIALTEAVMALLHDQIVHCEVKND